MESYILEGMTVSRLNLMFLSTEYIKPEIAENDKTPSWDGALYLYKNKNGKKEDLYGRCSVQIKGKQVLDEKLKKKKIKYPVQTADMKNYRNDGGVLYFVGYVTETKNMKFYYANLLPYDLEKILRRVQGQATKSIELQEWPEKPEKIRYIVRDFIDNSRLQYSTTLEKPEILLENLKQNDKLILFGNPFLEPHHMIGMQKYLYKQLADGVVRAIGKFRIESQKIGNVDIATKIDGVSYFDKCDIEFSQDRQRLYLGKCITITVPEKSKTVQLTFSYNGSISDIIQGLEFFAALNRGHKLEIIPIGECTDIDIDVCLDDIMDDLECYKKLQQIIEELHIKQTIDATVIMDSMAAGLEDVYHWITDKSGVQKETNMPLVWGLLAVGDLKLLVINEQKKDGLCYCYNFFDKDVLVGKPLCEVPDAGNKRYPISIYTVLEKRHFLEASNMDYDGIEKSIRMIPYSKFYGNRINNCLLEMLAAYDAQPDAELLNLSIRIADYLQQKDNQPIHVMNHLQAVLRKRNLNNDEKQRLFQIRENAKDWQIKAGVAVLLGNKDDYDFYLSNMDSKNKEIFLRYPIVNLISTAIDSDMSMLHTESMNKIAVTE